MITANRQILLLIVLLAVLLLGSAIWAHSRLADARQAKLNAENNLGQCQLFESRLRQLDERHLQASRSLGDEGQLLRRVEAALQSATGGTQARREIIPLPARKIEGTVYNEQLTEVRLKDMSMEQLANFVYDLTVDRSGITASSMQLSAGQDPGSMWTANVVLSYLVYESPAGDTKQ